MAGTARWVGRRDPGRMRLSPTFPSISCLPRSAGSPAREPLASEKDSASGSWRSLALIVLFAAVEVVASTRWAPAAVPREPAEGRRLAGQRVAPGKRRPAVGTEEVRVVCPSAARTCTDFPRTRSAPTREAQSEELMP